MTKEEAIHEIEKVFEPAFANYIITALTEGATSSDEEQQPCEDMRDATEEERKSTKDYIDSISKPTGLQFDDIYEELDFVQPHKKISVNLQPCEDCISREATIDAIYKKHIGGKDAIENAPINDLYACGLEEAIDAVENMPSVTPQPKRGKWEVIRKEYEFMGGIVNEPQGCKCSNCGGIVKFKSDFCPNCGCRMDADIREVQNGENN